MTVYQWLCILGVQGIVTALVGIVIGLINGHITKQLAKKHAKAEDIDLIKSAIQVSLRKDLYDMYENAVIHQSVTADEQKLFLSMYQAYHSLGENGVMDEIKAQYLEYKVIG